MLDTERQKKIYWYLVGIYNLSPTTKEPYFGKSPCECCKSDLAGERYEFTGIVGKVHNNNEKVTVSCCIDCYLYLFS